MILQRSMALVVLSAGLAACTPDSNGSRPDEPTATEASQAETANVRDIEIDLARQIDKRFGVAGTQVNCPPEVSWQVGDSFLCDVAVPGQPPGFGEVTLEREGGKYGWYISNTCRDEKRELGSSRPGCVTPQPGYSDLLTPSADR